MSRANLSVFRSKVLALVDTLKLTGDEVVGFGLTLAASYGAHLPRHALRQMLDSAVTESKALPETPEMIRDRVLARMAATARAATSQGKDGWAALAVAYPDTPAEVIGEAWALATGDDALDWCSKVELMLDSAPRADAAAQASIDGDPPRRQVGGADGDAQ